MTPEIFREYDIRGVVDEQITDSDVFLLGRGIGTYLAEHGCRHLTLGRDCRLSSDRFNEQMIRGLIASGCHITDIGVCPTPVLYFSISHFQQEGGVMITASHNPPEYNGFKVCLGTDSVHGQEIQKIREIIEKEAFTDGEGSRSEADAITPYKQYLTENIEVPNTMRIGVDAGNGTAGVIAVPILKALNCEVHDLYCEMDGNFPNHEADPTVAANLEDLIALVKEKKLDIGIGYDGDGDRIGVIDENGDIIYGDQLMIIFSREILTRKPGATFISEVKCSKTMYDDIEKNGGRAIMWKTGHSLIKEKMKAENAELAGEMSGHMFFADRYLGYDDAIYASGRLIEILSRTGRTVSDLLADVPPTFSTPEIRVECPDHIKFKVVEKLTEAFRKDYNVIDIDGVRVVFDDGWGLVRASNTQPALVLRFEALSRERLEEIKDMVEKRLAEIQESL
ncbi:MAG: phosphomannomutase/phosphoglucomutase [Desulfobacterales bacterium]|nr:phosphomannomutase/phosphoglucomutase [Desulfobacterales bacterium]